MAELLGTRKRILDLGCGDGVLLRAAAAVSPDATRLVGIDIDAARLPVDTSPRFEYLVGDALRLPEDQEFDGIISNPPYIAARLLGARQRDLLRRAFSSLSGQFDLAFAFVEKAIGLLEEDGRGVFLLPEGVKTRPAAERLRQLLDRECVWGTVQVETRPYAEDVGVAAEILWFDRTDKPQEFRSEVPSRDKRTLRVGVGIATGANTVFVRSSSDPWLPVVEPEFVRQFIRGRDIARSEEMNGLADSGARLIVPYVVEDERLSPADEREHPGLGRFLDSHWRDLGEGQNRGPGYFIQCPPRALIGPRVVVPEVFREPMALVVPHGVAVLNSAFVISPTRSVSAQELASALNTPTGRRTILDRTRQLGSGYRRVTASGLRAALADLTRY